MPKNRQSRHEDKSNKPIIQKQVDRLSAIMGIRIDKRAFKWTDDVYRQVLALASLGCTEREIGLVIGCSSDTVQRRKRLEVKEVGADKSRLCAALEIGKADMHVSIRRAAMGKVEGGNTAMIIYLMKVLLGLVERKEISHEVKSSVAELSDEELAIRAAAITAKSIEGKS